VDWVCVEKNRDHWSALVETIESLCSIKCGEFLKLFWKDFAACSYFVSYLGRLVTHFYLLFRIVLTILIGSGTQGNRERVRTPVKKCWALQQGLSD
jgi:hypothetical protein